MRAAAAIAAVALVAAGLAAAWLWRAPAPFEFAWPAGSVYTYRVSLEVRGSIAPSAQDALSAALAVDGELELRSYGRLGATGDWVLGARLARVKRLDWTLGGLPLVERGGEALVGPELTLVAAPDGTFRSLYAAPDAPPAHVNLLRQVLAPLEVVVSPGERAWTREQTNPVGDVRVAYEVRAARPGLLSIERRPVRYTRLAASPATGAGGADPQGRFEAALDRAGHLDRVGGWEDVSVGRVFGQRTEVEVRLVSVTRGGPGGADAPARLAGLVPSGLGEVSASPQAQRQVLEQRAGGLDLEGLVRELRVHGPAPAFPRLGEWMWRSTGFLRLHPERCRDLVEVFAAPELNDRARARVLDLLASTGHAEAQAVLRELLDTREAKSTEAYPLFVQRLSLVEAPTVETVEYLRSKVERGDGAHTLAAAHALGSAIGRRARDGEVDERSAALLRAGLAAAGSAREKAGWLGAVGNAGLERDVPLLARYAADAEPMVRGAAADALRKAQTPAAERLLLDLARDTDAAVQARALHALSGYRLAPEQLSALGRQVAAGELDPRSFGTLVTLLESHRDRREAVLPVLDALHGRGVSSPRLLLRMRALRESL